MLKREGQTQVTVFEETVPGIDRLRTAAALSARVVAAPFRALARRADRARAIAHLKDMTDEHLADIGLSRPDIERAVRGLPPKRHWDPRGGERSRNGVSGRALRAGRPSMSLRGAAHRSNVPVEKREHP
jgi:uncharacterized protein YjiS (DUF1127 family)